MVIRFLFGVGEAGAFPIGDTVTFALDSAGRARFSRKASRHAGSRLAAALTPSLVVLLMVRYGWRTAS